MKQQANSTNAHNSQSAAWQWTMNLSGNVIPSNKAKSFKLKAKVYAVKKSNCFENKTSKQSHKILRQRNIDTDDLMLQTNKSTLKQETNFAFRNPFTADVKCHERNKQLKGRSGFMQKQPQVVCDYTILSTCSGETGARSSVCTRKGPELCRVSTA